MVAVAITNSLSLVGEELENTIEQAESELKAFLEERDNQDHLTACAELMHQVAGTFKIVALKGADALMRDVSELIDAMPTGEQADISRHFEALTNAMHKLENYIEFVQGQQVERPELLVPLINEIRKISKKPLLAESAFVELSCIPLSPLKSETTSNDNLASVGARVRLMYQVGLLGVIREEAIPISIKLMCRALERMEALVGNTPMVPLWIVARAGLEAFAAEEMTLTQARKLLFSKLERSIKKTIIDPESETGQAPDEGLIKDFLYLICLAENPPELGQKVMAAYGVEQLDYSDHHLEQDRLHVSGPGNAVMGSVAKALKEELAIVKDEMDLLARGVSATGEGKGLPAIICVLAKIADTLAMLSLDESSNTLKDQIEKINGAVGEDEEINDQAMLELADTVLYVESTIAAMATGNVSGGTASESIAKSQLDDAHAVVLDEARSGLVLAKRSIVACMEANWDKMHLANVVSTLESVRGGLVFMGMQRAANILYTATQFIEECIVKSSAQPEPQVMETLADALTSIEYYLEGLSGNKNLGEGVLDLAAESLSALGYKVTETVE